LRRDPAAKVLDVKRLVIRNWNSSSVKVRENGTLSTTAQTGIVHRRDGQDLVIWIPQTSTTPLRVPLSQN
jgi:hypothetical protein